MGISKADDEPGHQSPANGYDSIYNTHTYRDYIFNKRPKNVNTKRNVVLLTVDVISLFIIMGIIKRLTDAKEIIALIVGIWYLGARSVIITVKIMSFVGKYAESIKKGFGFFKDIFKE